MFVEYGQVCPAMSNFFGNNKAQISPEILSYFVYFLHVVTNASKLKCYVVIVDYDPACSKFCEKINCQYL